MEQEKQIHTEVVDIDDLIQDDHNFNKGTEAGAELIGRSFKEHGAGRSVFIDKNNRLVGGNKAQKGFKGAGYRKVVIVDSDPDTLVAVRRKDVDLDTKEGREMAMLDNLTTQVNLAWDKAELESISDQVEGFDVGDFGFEIDDLPQVVMPTDKQGEGEGEPQTEVKEDDFDPDEVHESKVHRGEVWQLGEHRLMCGDSTSAEDVAKLMNGERADMIFTDPPYGVAYTGGVIHGNKINTDHKREMLKNDDVDIYSAFIPLINDMIDDGAIYIFYATVNTFALLKPLRENGIELNSIIVWNKVNTGYADMNSNYKNKYEPCFYGKRKGHKLNFVGPTNECTVWDIEKDRINDLHPTQKPIVLPARAIKNSSQQGGIVADLFGGSGSTLIACEQLGRKCRMMELDPHYCTVIIARWEKLTGQKAIKLNQ